MLQHRLNRSLLLRLSVPSDPATPATRRCPAENVALLLLLPHPVGVATAATATATQPSSILPVLGRPRIRQRIPECGVALPATERPAAPCALVLSPAHAVRCYSATPAARGPRLTAHCSRPTAHGLWLLQSPLGGLSLRQREALQGFVEPIIEVAPYLRQVPPPCKLINPITTLFKHASTCGACPART